MNISNRLYPRKCSGSTPTMNRFGHSSACALRSTPTSIDLTSSKNNLISLLSSLDRGLAASVDNARSIEAMSSCLEALGGDVNLRELEEGVTVDGNWRLLYSSAFNSGNLGGSRPGPPAGLLPTTLGQVYQRIFTSSAGRQRLDNIVELLLPQLPFMGPPQESAGIRLSLQHEYEIEGRTTIQIVFQDTSVELFGLGSIPFLPDGKLPELLLPSLPEPLKPPRFLRSAKFDLVYLDETVRITRGDRGELRIYYKDVVSNEE